MSKKTTKRALLTSALSLILCFTMLLGTTYAWFTDSVTSGGNIIKSGTLDVEMAWADGTENPTANTTKWTDASTGAIFNYDLWEPGYTEVRHISIANIGTLALKYKVQIVANGEAGDLADVIDVYYMDPAEQIANRAALAGKTPMGTLTEALAGMSETASGNLKAGEKDTITIALKMQESAGNEYQNKSIGTDFSIQLLATQLTYEEDSFGNDYDEDADGLPDHPEFGDLSADVTVTAVAGEDTILESADKGAKAVVPADSASGDVTFTVVKDAVSPDVSILATQNAIAYDIDVTGQNPGTVVAVSLNIGKDLTGVIVYHDGIAMTSADTGVDQTFMYDRDTGILTIYSSTFSNYTIVKNASNVPSPIDEITNIEGTYQIRTFEDLLGIKDYINNNNTKDVVMAIQNDIDVAPGAWESISINGYIGDGVITLEGNGHKLTGLTSPLVSGTWAGKSGLVIHNLTISNSNIVDDLNDAKGNIGVGAFVGWPQASSEITLDGCHVIDSTIKGGHWTGGLIGIASGYSGNDGPVFETVSIKNCSVKNCTVEGKGSIGSIIGHSTADAWTLVTIENCVVEGNIIKSTGSSINKAGSVVGTVGVAGTEKITNGISHTGGTYVSQSKVYDNTVTSGSETILRLFGRVASNGGKFYVDNDLVAYCAGNEDVIVKDITELK